eukprot:1614651-Amphidinium_carterae.1
MADRNVATGVTNFIKRHGAGAIPRALKARAERALAYWISWGVAVSITIVAVMVGTTATDPWADYPYIRPATAYASTHRSVQVCVYGLAVDGVICAWLSKLRVRSASDSSEVSSRHEPGCLDCSLLAVLFHPLLYTLTPYRANNNTCRVQCTSARERERERAPRIHGCVCVRPKA